MKSRSKFQWKDNGETCQVILTTLYLQGKTDEQSGSRAALKSYTCWLSPQLCQLQDGASGQLLKLLKPQLSCFQMQLMTHRAQGLCEGSLLQSLVPGSVIGGSYYLSDHARICRSLS